MNPDGRRFSVRESLAHFERLSQSGDSPPPQRFSKRQLSASSDSFSKDSPTKETTKKVEEKEKVAPEEIEKDSLQISEEKPKEEIPKEATIASLPKEKKHSKKSLVETHVAASKVPRRNSVGEGNPAREVPVEGKRERFGTWRLNQKVPGRSRESSSSFLSVSSSPISPPTISLFSDTIQCVVLGHCESGFGPFVEHLKEKGQEEDECIKMEYPIGGKTYNLEFLLPLPSGMETKSSEYTTTIAKYPKGLSTVFLLFFNMNSKISSKELKAWKTDIVKAKHNKPNMILVGTKTTTNSTVTSTQGINMAIKLQAAEYCEYRPEVKEDIVELLEKAILCSFADNRGKLVKKKAALEEREKKEKEKEKEKDEKERESRDSFLSSAPKALKGIVPKQKTKSHSPEDIIRETLFDLLDRGCRAELVSPLDHKVLQSLLFNTPDKIVRRVQEKVHRHASERSSLFSKSLFSRSELKLSKFSVNEHIKPSQINIPVFDSLLLTNNWHTKVTFHFENNYFFSQELFLSFFPPSGEIEKGKSVEIKVSIVGNAKIKLREIFSMDIKVDLDGEQYLERFYIPVSIDVDEPTADSTKFWEVDPLLLDTLSGASASVFLCILFGVEVAAKKWEFGRLDDPPQDFHRELTTIMGLRHTNVVSFIGAVTVHPGKAYIITEYLEHGGLDTVLKNPNIDLPFPLRVRMAVDANRGMVFMHERGKMHRDLKSLNLLVDKKFTVKVADFGESRDIGTFSTMTKGIGTYLWMAPEIVNHQEYSFAADVYSFGMVLWELVERKLPEREMDDIIKGVPLPIPKGCPPEFAFVIKRCCEVDPKKRPNFKETLEMLEFIYKSLTEEEDKKVEKQISAISGILPSSPKAPSESSDEEIA